MTRLYPRGSYIKSPAPSMRTLRVRGGGGEVSEGSRVVLWCFDSFCESDLFLHVLSPCLSCGSRGCYKDRDIAREAVVRTVSFILSASTLGTK